MAVFSFKWKFGQRPSPKYVQVPDDVVYQEKASSTFKAGFPLGLDTGATASPNIVFDRADVADIIVFLASRDAGNASAAIDMSDYTADSDLPQLVLPGDVFSVTKSTAGANAATAVTDLGKGLDWIASDESGETTKAVLSSTSTYKQWLVVGFDDRDAITTSGGRLLVMATSFGLTVNDAQNT